MYLKLGRLLVEHVHCLFIMWWDWLMKLLTQFNMTCPLLRITIYPISTARHLTSMMQAEEQKWHGQPLISNQYKIETNILTKWHKNLGYKNKPYSSALFIYVNTQMFWFRSVSTLSHVSFSCPDTRSASSISSGCSAINRRWSWNAKTKLWVKHAH